MLSGELCKDIPQLVVEENHINYMILKRIISVIWYSIYFKREDKLEINVSIKFMLKYLS